MPSGWLPTSNLDRISCCAAASMKPSFLKAAGRGAGSALKWVPGRTRGLLHSRHCSVTGCAFLTCTGAAEQLSVNLKWLQHRHPCGGWTEGEWFRDATGRLQSWAGGFGRPVHSPCCAPRWQRNMDGCVCQVQLLRQEGNAPQHKETPQLPGTGNSAPPRLGLTESGFGLVRRGTTLCCQLLESD